MNALWPVMMIRGVLERVKSVLLSQKNGAAGSQRVRCYQTTSGKTLPPQDHTQRTGWDCSYISRAISKATVKMNVDCGYTTVLRNHLEGRNMLRHICNHL